MFHLLRVQDTEEHCGNVIGSWLIAFTDCLWWGEAAPSDECQARITILCDHPPDCLVSCRRVWPGQGRSYKLQLTLALGTQTASELGRGLRWPSPELERSSSTKSPEAACPASIMQWTLGGVFNQRKSENTTEQSTHFCCCHYVECWAVITTVTQNWFCHGSQSSIITGPWPDHI